MTFLDMTDDEYFDFNALNNSTLKQFVKNPQKEYSKKEPMKTHDEGETTTQRTAPLVGET